MGAVIRVQDLEANPETLGEFEQAWKTQVEKLSWAADTIRAAANRVVEGEGWSGPAAQRYGAHRRRLVNDLDEAADQAGRVARSIGECIQLLKFNTGLLEDAKGEVRKSVPSRSREFGYIDFHPEDEKQKDLAVGLMNTYNSVRSRVDDKLEEQIADIGSATKALEGLASRWSKRTVRILNWNIQQGGGGNPGPSFWDPFRPWRGDSEDKQGTQKGDMGDTAQRIIDGRIDVATLQEVFESGSNELQKELDKRAPGQYRVHFGEASTKGRFDQFTTGEGFGNAVVVRTGGNVEVQGNPEPTALPSGPGEGRSTTKVTLRVGE